MIQVWLYDENKVFIESIFVDEVIENMTTIPLLVGYVKPTFNEELQEWFEGATAEEIQKWKDENVVVPQATLEDKIDILEAENEALKARVTMTEDALLDMMLQPINREVR